MNDELKQYRALLDRLARNRINQRIPNSVPAHAGALLETMFRYAQQDVRIFSGLLDPYIYGERSLIDAARRFLVKPGASLRILLQKHPGSAWTSQHALVKSIAEIMCPPAFEIRAAQGNYAEEGAKHFAVIDDCGFRFEHDHAGKSAVANFNEPKVARELVAAFDRAFSLGTPLQLPASA